MPYANPEDRRAYMRRYWRANRAIGTANRRKWIQANRERQREIQRRHYARHREETIARTRRWKLENPDRNQTIAKRNNSRRVSDGAWSKLKESFK